MFLFQADRLNAFNIEVVNNLASRLINLSLWKEVCVFRQAATDNGIEVVERVMFLTPDQFELLPNLLNHCAPT